MVMIDFIALGVSGDNEQSLIKRLSTFYAVTMCGGGNAIN